MLAVFLDGGGAAAVDTLLNDLEAASAIGSFAVAAGMEAGAGVGAGTKAIDLSAFAEEAATVDPTLKNRRQGRFIHL